VTDFTRPAFGAVTADEGTTVTVWAPAASRVRLHRRPGRVAGSADELTPAGHGLWLFTTPDVRAGDRYLLQVDDGPLWPDPASRAQPDGVHAASEVIDPRAFAWTDRAWTGISLRDLVVYELHVGTFAGAGTFRDVRDRLPYLVDLGVTAVELMPVTAFPGRWNWGYDVAGLFSPCAAYGRPDDLRDLVNEAHRLGLAVLLDVVYNHLGPDGAYLAAFVPTLFMASADNPWGGALDFDGPTGPMLRQFFIENAVHWVREYHVDGLRLDATHAIVERGQPTFLRDLAAAVRAEAPNREVLVVAEDDRNLSAIVRPAREEGWGLDAVWADDFHHEIRVHLTGDRDGYFGDFEGTTAQIADTIAHGWFYRGAFSPYFGRERGTDTTGVPLERFVVCIQNHDQVGNRALGERLHHQIDTPAWLAATTLLLLAAETPLLFMGQEWAATTPFLFFTDHDEPLGSQVVEGRRREFRDFDAFRTTAIPSPQDPETFDRSRLRWDEVRGGAHAEVLRATRDLLALRRRLAEAGVRMRAVSVADAGSVVMRHVDAGGTVEHLALIRLSGRGPVRTAGAGPNAPATGWTVLFDSRGLAIGNRPQPSLQISTTGIDVAFDGPGAVVLRLGAQPEAA